jgi:transposase
MKANAPLERMFESLWPHLDERTRRLFAAAQASARGHGGITEVARLCGLSRVTITKGIKQLEEPALPAGRSRKPGGGRQRLEKKDPGFEGALERLLEENTRGDPQSPLRWTCKSTRALAGQMKAGGHTASHVSIASALKRQGYSLQANRKTQEGADHPDRDAQFRHINGLVKKALGQGQPVISVDTKKKELIGNYDNKGRQWRASGQARQVNGHDFPSPEVPRAYPYGIYDIGRNQGCVNIGTDHDTSAFAVASIRGWWKNEGKKAHGKASRLVITADAGGSNGYRRGQWKLELQKLSDETGLPIEVSHFPPGTSKWNKIEHRLFSFISSNWRGEPLCDYETVVRLIGATSTSRGLKVTCRLDYGKYPTGQKVTRRELEAVRLFPGEFHGEWNYVIRPTSENEM